MAINDIKLGAKIKFQEYQTKRLNAKDHPADVASLIKLANANMRSNIGGLKYVKSILVELEKSAKQGNFAVAVPAKSPGACREALKFFADKGFIVASGVKFSGIVICWAGGNYFRKMMKPGTTIDLVAGDIKRQVESKAGPGSAWVNPQSGNPKDIAKIIEKWK